LLQFGFHQPERLFALQHEGLHSVQIIPHARAPGGVSSIR
jgi:hypothetical protein